MALRTDDSQTASGFYLIRKLDIRTTTGHVRGNRDNALTTGFGYNLCLFLMQFRIQHIMRNTAHSEHTAQKLTHLHRGRTHQYRTAFANQFLDLSYHGIVFLALGAVNAVVHIDAGNRTIRRNHHHIEFVDIPELTRFRLGRTGHTREFVVHTEIILQGDGSKRLGSGLHFHVFLCLHSLMQTIRPAATLHDTARLLIYDLHLVVHHHIIHILLKKRISFQELINGMNAL